MILLATRVDIHGGGDHVKWIRRIDEFTCPELENFIKPSYLPLKKGGRSKVAGFILDRNSSAD